MWTWAFRNEGKGRGRCGVSRGREDFKRGLTGGLCGRLSGVIRTSGFVCWRIFGVSTHVYILLFCRSRST